MDKKSPIRPASLSGQHRLALSDALSTAGSQQLVERGRRMVDGLAGQVADSVRPDAPDSDRTVELTNGDDVTEAAQSLAQSVDEMVPILLLTLARQERSLCWLRWLTGVVGIGMVVAGFVAVRTELLVRHGEIVIAEMSETRARLETAVRDSQRAQVETKRAETEIEKVGKVIEQTVRSGCLKPNVTVGRRR